LHPLGPLLPELVDENLGIPAAVDPSLADELVQVRLRLLQTFFVFVDQFDQTLGELVSHYGLVILSDDHVLDFFDSDSWGLDEIGAYLLDLAQLEVEPGSLRHIRLIPVVFSVLRFRVSDLELGGVRNHLEKPALHKFRLWGRGPDIYFVLLESWLGVDVLSVVSGGYRTLGIFCRNRARGAAQINN